MTPDHVLSIGREAALLMLLIAGPILAVGLLVGLAVSVFQAVTQIQEQTLVFVPKIIVMTVITVLLLSWVAVRLSEFATQMFTW